LPLHTIRNRLSCGQGGKPAVDATTERVKGICAFTRSIGDCQMKDPAAAALFNSFRTVKVEPRPGTLLHDSTKPVRKPHLVAQRHSFSRLIVDVFSALKRLWIFSHKGSFCYFMSSLCQASLLPAILPPERLVSAARVGAAVHQLRVGAPGGMPLRWVPYRRLRRRLGEPHHHTTITIITLSSDYYHL